ncbi:MAG: glycosyltransferase family 2 protein [bacterium]|nr:glycosyltransferase family 2 protein [bacterium]
MPSFAIILTTHKRPDPAQRAIASVLAQTYNAWRLIVVNDSPTENYKEVEDLVYGEQRILYLQNDRNIGKNASVNRAFDLLRAENFEGYVVFLDDDDWLAPTCLADFAGGIEKEPGVLWLVSKRAQTDSTSFTINRTGKQLIDYYRDCLLFKLFSGDATHCIGFPEASRCRFLNTVRNAEEWFFFSQLARYVPKFIYLSSVGTYSEGYLEGGLTRTTLSRSEKVDLFLRICKELSQTRAWSASTALYMFLRFGKIFFTR